MFKDGTEAIISGKRSIVAVRPSANTYTSRQRPTFIVSVFNRADKPIVFSTEDISASVAGSPLKVFTYDELVAEIEKQRKMAAIAAALAGASQAMNAAQAGTQYHYGSYNTSYYGGSGNYVSGYGTYSGYTYNPAAAAQAQAAANAQMTENLSNINASANVALSDLGRTILKKESVLPHAWYGGLVEVQQTPVPDSSNIIYLKVIFDDEEHNFEFTQTKVN
ncbi:MAG: hypothetical protein HY794_13795 [Desulfarculus sp.]|nr:hypothetical protein [Desulfarculus sp.]